VFYFERKVWLWEDLDFNRRISEAGGVLCKCNRFQQVVDQNKRGGCADLVAAPAGIKVHGTVVSAENPQAKCEVVHYLSKAMASQHETLPPNVVEWLQKNLCDKVTQKLCRQEAPVTADTVQSLKVTAVLVPKRTTKELECRNFKTRDGAPLQLDSLTKRKWQRIEAIWLEMIVNVDLDQTTIAQEPADPVPVPPALAVEVHGTIHDSGASNQPPLSLTGITMARELTLIDGRLPPDALQQLVVDVQTCAATKMEWRGRTIEPGNVIIETVNGRCESPVAIGEHQFVSLAWKDVVAVRINATLSSPMSIVPPPLDLRPMDPVSWTTVQLAEWLAGPPVNSKKAADIIQDESLTGLEIAEFDSKEDWKELGLGIVEAVKAHANLKKLIQTAKISMGHGDSTDTT